MGEPIFNFGKATEEDKVNKDIVLSLEPHNNYMVREKFPWGIICTVTAVPDQDHLMKVEPDDGYDIPEGTTMASTNNSNSSSSLVLNFKVVKPNMDSKSFSLTGKINPSTDPDNSSVVALSLEETI